MTVHPVLFLFVYLAFGVITAIITAAFLPLEEPEEDHQEHIVFILMAIVLWPAYIVFGIFVEILILMIQLAVTCQECGCKLRMTFLEIRCRKPYNQDLIDV